MGKISVSNNNHHSKSAIDCAGIEFLGDREGQEDYFFAQVKLGVNEAVAILADGMGGHASGEVASQRAVEAFNKTVSEYPSDSIAAKLAAALQQANNEIANSIKNDASLDGMGCTLVGVHIGSDGLRWISVGDSPLFLFRGGSLRQLNADHSMAPVIEESLRQGKISKEEALNHPHRNALRSAVMGSELTLIDAPVLPCGLMAGDIVVLASDGIMSLSKTEIQAILKKSSHHSSSEICLLLIDAVKNKRRPRQDNTTAIVVKVSSNMGSSDGPSRIVRAAAVVSILAFLSALGWYLYPKLNLKSIIYDGAKKPAATVEAPMPVPVPERVESKVLEIEVIEPKTSSNKAPAPIVVDKKKAGNSDNPSKRAKGLDSANKNQGAKATDEKVVSPKASEVDSPPSSVKQEVSSSSSAVGSGNGKAAVESDGQSKSNTKPQEKQTPASDPAAILNGALTK